MKTYHTIVFQQSEGGGNPCPVTLNADALSTEEMQAMTREFGFESVYLMEPTRSDCDIKARYFVPLHEMEMCIHATIGSATVLVRENIFRKSPIIYETVYGPIRVDWVQEAGRIKVSVNQFLPKYAEHNPKTSEICEVLRISAEDLLDYPVQSVATSRMKLIIPLKNREILDHLDPDFEKLWNLCDTYETTGFYPFAPEKTTDGSTIFFARQFPKRAGYPEDPATGVAASALGAYLAKYKFLPLKNGWNTYQIRQGFAMHRPSVIESEIYTENGCITATRVCGDAFITDTSI